VTDTLRPPSGNGPQGAPRGPRPGLYVHVPFCVHRCAYCDFVTWADRQDEVDTYLDSLAAEADRRAPEAPEGVETVYLGGGTPSLLGPDRLARVLSEVLAGYRVRDAAEVTVECNPESVTRELAAALVELGVDRVSLGVQSFDPEELVLLERAHDRDRAEEALAILRGAGLPRISLDLIYGLPGQHPTSFMASVDRALELDPGHISSYGLTVEPGSTWGREGPPARLVLPDGDDQADMYEGMLRATRRAGYRAYEISSFCRPGQESLHNLKYWRGEPVIGLGVGAWGGAPGGAGVGVAWRRQRNSASLEAYREDQRQGRGPFVTEALDHTELARERLMLGLRLDEGVDPEVMGDPAEVSRARGVLEKYQALGLVEPAGALWRLTDRGRMLANEVMAELL
jgi:oxygen-independent coproporphyrinogen-3 oxidase